MQPDRIRALLADVRDGTVGLDAAMTRLRDLPYEDLGFANIDHHRTLRKGFPEVIFGQGKTPRQVAEIFASLARRGSRVMATRATREAYDAVRLEVAEAAYHEAARVITWRQPGVGEPVAAGGTVLVISAGTTDIPVAEEAAITAEMMGCRVECLFDVGAAGLHRLLGRREQMDRAAVYVVVAGMDGVLPTIVSGLVARPVVAVPTSVGYGASFEGIGPLLTMLNSCSPGVVVVNIDNGFGAGYFAAMVNR